MQLLWHNFKIYDRNCQRMRKWLVFIHLCLIKLNEGRAGGMAAVIEHQVSKYR